MGNKWSPLAHRVGRLRGGGTPLARLRCCLGSLGGSHLADARRSARDGSVEHGEHSKLSPSPALGIGDPPPAPRRTGLRAHLPR